MFSWEVLQTGASTYTVLARFIFEGSTQVGTPTEANVIYSVQTPVSQADIRIFDSTNSLTIAEATNLSSTTEVIQSLGAVSNIPAGQALFELQALEDAAGFVRLFALDLL